MKITGISAGDEVFIQILQAEWYGTLIHVDDYGIEFMVSKGKGKGNIVFSTERYVITKIAEKKKDEEGDVRADG